MVLLDGLVVAVIAIFEELLTTTMFVELSRCSETHDPFDIIEYLFRYQTLDLWKNFIGILVCCRMLATQESLDCCKVKFEMQEQCQSQRDALVIDTFLVLPVWVWFS